MYVYIVVRFTEGCIYEGVDKVFTSYANAVHYVEGITGVPYDDTAIWDDLRIERSKVE